MCFLHSYSHRLKLASLRFVVALFRTLRGYFRRILDFSIFLRSLDKSIMQKTAEISGGIDVCGKLLKTRFKTVFSFLTHCKS